MSQFGDMGLRISDSILGLLSCFLKELEGIDKMQSLFLRNSKSCGEV